jgi:site-specific DNA-methyltransferase (adenine-specific)
MKDIPDNSVDAVVTDPPYFRVKGEAWDRQWDDADKFISWIGELCEQWQRLLRPNGSLYCFASPKMAARVEVEIGRRFGVLNQIVWLKPDANCDRRHVAQVIDRNVARSFFPNTERIIFAEHYGADNMAKGEAGYVAKCDERRGFVFEPLRAWFLQAWAASGLSRRAVDAACGCSNVTQYWFLERNYQIPTPERYAVLQSLAPNAFAREYEDLRREYEHLRREYEDLRRPFSVTADVPYTDVWTFPTVQAYKGKHVCEKPISLLSHIISVSSRPGDTVLDCFAGSGTTGVAAVNLGRQFIGIEIDPEYFKIAKKRIEEAL